MNTTLTAAAVLCAATGLTHSILGERMIFRSEAVGSALPPRFRGILRASWHATTLLGFGLAAIMLDHGLSGTRMPPVTRFAMAAALAACAAVVLVWTRGRHPGWIALGSVAALCLID